ncbi:MAG: prepilin peptidase, partial [Planctomycetia bacterium]|nr:prepilin peptidase [Planctomycetia bacterium]
MSAIDIIWFVWFTLLGSCIGSFSNVVIWRMPRGMSLSRPASHCPGCGHAIRWYHNLPVFGWLWLRGRCADCHEPIAIRYPVVEATVAGFFLIVAIIFRTDFSVAVNAALPPMDLPLPGISGASGLSDMTTLVNVTPRNVDPDPIPMIRLFIQATAIALIPTQVLILALIRVDRQRIPK